MNNFMPIFPPYFSNKLRWWLIFLASAPRLLYSAGYLLALSALHPAGACLTHDDPSFPSALRLSFSGHFPASVLPATRE